MPGAIATKGRKRSGGAAKIAPAPDAYAAIREAFGKQGSDPGVAKKAIEDATGLARSLWISFLTFGTYLVITVASVTHEALFKETPIKLPLLNTELPLVAFFWVAPILFLIFQLYLLLNLKLLADQVHHFSDLMKEAGVDENAQDDARLQLPNFMIVQMLGGHYSRRGVFAWFALFLSTWITLIGAPVVLMIFIQLQFLPYHSEPVTWVHRIVLLLIFGLVWWFWLSIRRKLSWLALSLPPLGTAFMIYLSWLVMTFPGEPHHGWRAQQMPSPAWLLGLSNVPTMQEALFGVRDGPETKVAGWFENRLVYSGFKTIESEQLVELEKRATAVANIRANGAKSELIAAKRLILPGLYTASLSGRRFEEADFDFIDLRRADLRNAKMEGAGLSSASLQGATLSGAKLQGAKLVLANLQGATLNKTSLQGADLFAAALHGAQLDGAFMQGAQLNFASLQGARLDGASLHLASLINAQMQGASLNRALLVGASLNSASLNGALLDFAALQGASFFLASLQGASLHSVSIWRTSINVDNILDFTLIKPVWDDVFLEARKNEEYAQKFRVWHQELEIQALKETPISVQQNILSGIQALDIGSISEDLEISFNEIWNHVENNNLSLESFTKERNEQLALFACDLDGSPYVARGIIRNFRIVEAPYELNLALIDQLLSRDCAGTKSLAEFERQSLIDMRKVLSPPPFAPEASK